MTFSLKERKLIESELRRLPKLETKKFIGIKRKKSGRFVEVFKSKKKGTIEEFPTNINRLKFKLRVAKSR